EEISHISMVFGVPMYKIKENIFSVLFTTFGSTWARDFPQWGFSRFPWRKKKRTLALSLHQIPAPDFCGDLVRGAVLYPPAVHLPDRGRPETFPGSGDFGGAAQKDGQKALVHHHLALGGPVYPFCRLAADLDARL